MDILFSVANPHLYAKLLMDMLGQVLCGLNTAMLTARAPE